MRVRFWRRHRVNEAFELVTLRGGGRGIRSLRYGEICHPGVGPREEAEAVYVEALSLRRRWLDRGGVGEPFVIWDVGLGGAANAMAVMQAAGETGVRLRVISFDWNLEPLRYAVRHAAELGYFGGLERECRAFCEQGRFGFDHGKARIEWEFKGGDFTERVKGWATEIGRGGHPVELGKPTAVLYDPHSPAANPEMWTLPHFSNVRACLDVSAGCGLATYSRSTSVRVSLLLAGFWVGAGLGTATKEETTVAGTGLEWVGQPLGARWLERARRSRAADPWIQAPFGGRPLSEENWRKLNDCAQFGSKPGVQKPGASHGG